MKQVFFTILLLFYAYASFSQVVIPDEAEIDATAELKVYSTDK